VLTAQVVHPSAQANVKFLARYYSPGVWHGDVNSCCDLPRQLVKFHLTTSLPDTITPAMKLCEKARSFLESDANTPVLGVLCQVAMKLCGDQPRVRELVRWDTEAEVSERYPNEPQPWMTEYATSALPSVDIAALEMKLLRVRGVAELLAIGSAYETQVALTPNVVVNDDVTPAAGHTLPAVRVSFRGRGKWTPALKK